MEFAQASLHYRDRYFINSEVYVSHFVTFLQNNSQLENLIYINELVFVTNEEVEKAIYSLSNLKSLMFEYESPIENYLGSKKIKRLVVYKPSIDADRNWNYLGEFPLLTYLKIAYSPVLKYDFFAYLQLDRLEYLLIEECTFEKKDRETIFQMHL